MAKKGKGSILSQLPPEYDTDWNGIADVVANKNIYKEIVLKEISDEINKQSDLKEVGLPISVEVILQPLIGGNQKGFEKFELIDEIQTKFLKELEYREVIKDLSISEKYDDEEMEHYRSANFVVKNPSDFEKRKLVFANKIASGSGFKKLEKIKENVSAKKQDNSKESQKITKITFVSKKTSEGFDYNFYINEDVKNVKLLRQDSSRIRRFIKLVDGQVVGFDKYLLDYINSNKNCALYCAGRYDLTKIIERHGNSFRVCNEIKVRIINEKAYKRELNQTKLA